MYKLICVPFENDEDENANKKKTYESLKNIKLLCEKKMEEYDNIDINKQLMRGIIKYVNKIKKIEVKKELKKMIKNISYDVNNDEKNILLQIYKTKIGFIILDENVLNLYIDKICVYSDDKNICDNISKFIQFYKTLNLNQITCIHMLYFFEILFDAKKYNFFSLICGEYLREITKKMIKEMCSNNKKDDDEDYNIYKFLKKCILYCDCRDDIVTTSYIKYTCKNMYIKVEKNICVYEYMNGDEKISGKLTTIDEIKRFNKLVGINNEIININESVLYLLRIILFCKNNIYD